MKIAFLHTGQIHVKTFEGLAKALAPDVDTQHHVASDLLTRAQAQGLAQVADETAAILAGLAEADAVLCTCSTLGPLTDAFAATHANVVRIDRPLMEAACAAGSNIMVAICLESTRAPTLALLTECAAQKTVQITPQVVFCETAWPFFEQGDTEGFAAEIEASIRAVIADTAMPDCIVLAQASMRVAEAGLTNLGIPILSSPKLAVERVLSVARTSSKS